MDWTTVLALATWAQLSALALMLGAGVQHLLAVARLRLGSLDRAWVDARVARLLAAGGLTAAVAGYAGALAMLMDVTETSTLPTLSDAEAFFLETSFGPEWIVRLMLLTILALLSLALLQQRQLVRRWSAGFAGMAAVLLMSTAMSGHPMAEQGWQKLVAIASTTAHLLAAGVWIGGLPVLLLVLSAARSRSDAAPAHAVLERFSGLGLVAVAALIATGILNAMLRLGRPQDLLTSDYGRLLLAKGVLLAAMLVLAALNRFLWMPRLATSARASDNDLLSLGRSIAAELGLGILALGAAAWLGTEAPPM